MANSHNFYCYICDKLHFVYYYVPFCAWVYTFYLFYYKGKKNNKWRHAVTHTLKPEQIIKM